MNASAENTAQSWPQMEALQRLMRVRSLLQDGLSSLPALIDILAGDDPTAAAEAHQGLMGMLPLASLYERRPEDFVVADADEIRAPIPDWLKASCDGWGTTEDFASLCVERLAEFRTGAPERARVLLERLVNFWGIRRRLAELLEARGLSDLRRTYEELIVETDDIHFPEQICLSPTQACQLKCSFCYSADLPNVHKDDISDSKTLELLDWMHSKNIKRLSFAGGEPTLFRYFPALIRKAAEYKMEIFLTTNGLMAPAVVDALIEVRPLCITMHLTEEVLDAPKLLALFERNARSFLDQGIYTIIRANFMEPEQDLERYFHTAEKLGIKEIRCAVPVPSEQSGHDYVREEDMDAMGRYLGDFVAGGARRGIKTVLSKPFPVCKLPEHAAKAFLANGSLGVNCPVHLTDYSHNIMLYPDGSFSPCLALNMKSGTTIYDYDGVREAAQEYRSRIEDMTEQPMFPDHCPKCPLWQGARCVGGCLGYRVADS